MKSNQITILTSVALTALMCAGCTKDAAYDDLFETDSLDLTVQVGKGLTLPLGSSDKIMLTELLDTAKVKQLEADATGRFGLSETGTINPTSFTVDKKEVQVSPKINGKTFTLESVEQPQQLAELVAKMQEYHLEDRIEAFVNKPLSELAAAVVKINEELGNVIPAFGVDMSFSTKCDNLEFDASAGAFNLEANDVDKALVSVTKVMFEEAVTMTVGFEVSGLPVMDKNYKLTLKDFVLELPEYVLLDDNDDRDATHLKMDDLVCEAKKGATSASAIQSIKAKGFNFGSNPLVNNANTIRLQSTVGVSAKASTDEITVGLEFLTLTKDENGQYGVRITNPISVSPILEVTKATFSEVTGKFDPTIDPVESVIDLNLGEKMDFLKGDDVTIDLKNPAIHLNLKNNCPVGMMADITITTDQDKHVTFGGVNLTGTDGEVSVLLDANKVTEGSFNTLLSPMPNQITVNVQPRADREHDYTVKLGTTYNVSGDYAVDVPLVFNHVVITHNELVENVWGEDRDELTSKLGKLEKARIVMDVESTIPMDLELNIQATEYGRGDKLADGLLQCQHILIAKNTTSKVEAEISIPDTRRVGDLYFVFKGEGTDCELNANQYLRISSAKIQLPEGVTVDLND